MTTAFQSNAFQNNAFQIDVAAAGTAAQPDTVVPVGYPAVPALLLRRKLLEQKLIALVIEIKRIPELRDMSREATLMLAQRLQKRNYTEDQNFIVAVCEAIQSLAYDYIDLYDELPEPYKPTPITFEALAWAKLKSKALGTFH